MFENLKNRIKEETGSDINLIPSIVNSNQPKLLGKGRHSRSGSTTSLSSFTIDGNKEESTSSPSLDLKLADGKVVTPKEFKKLEAKEEEWRRKLQKKEEEFTVKLKKTEELWKKQLEDRERELKKVIDRKESEKRAIEEERNDLRVKNEKLEESAKKAADYQKKVCQYQEDIDQLEGFQTQEMAKIKHLLLVMEQEVAEKDKLLKDNNSQMEALKVELVKLRKFEQEYESIQKMASENAKSLDEMLKGKKCELEESIREYQELSRQYMNERNEKSALEEECIKVKELLEMEKKLNEDMSIALEKERQEKDDMMMRNAEISQEVQLAKQGIREQEMETSELQSKLASLEKKLAEKGKELDSLSHEKTDLLARIGELEKLEAEKELASTTEKDLKSRISQLENELFDKNKSIKMLQQRLSDMKKTLQRELKVPITTIDPGGADSDGFISPYASSTSAGANSAVITPSSSHQVHVSSRYRGDDVDEDVNDDVNFKYLKHVLMKFLTSREYEAKHLTRAVATLLRFSEEEERLLNETLEWKMSWFGTRPNLGNGQTAKTIPPS
ncbi:UNVERIFIED_CONTAM: hypothetical protein PYX00_006375 [Menopon gallinae]|uniref:GRIP domain-containing protein n=1 Tax=Menopon gallinae TaxID=328185 RepID=A0AAW2HVY6_9NEOP